MDGFYISNRENADGTGELAPLLSLEGYISATASFDALVVSAGVSGRLSLFTDFNLADLNGDGRVHISEIGAIFVANGGQDNAWNFVKVFTVDVRLCAGITIFVDTPMYVYFLFLSLIIDPFHK